MRPYARAVPTDQSGPAPLLRDWYAVESGSSAEISWKVVREMEGTVVVRGWEWCAEGGRMATQEVWERREGQS